MATIEIFGHVRDPNETLSLRRIEEVLKDGTLITLLGGVDNITEMDIEGEVDYSARNAYTFADKRGFEIKALTVVQTD